MLNQTRGSPLWMSPERVAIKILGSDLGPELNEIAQQFMTKYKVSNSDQVNSEKSDVYSFGIMFWEILTQEWPFVDLLTSESFNELFTIILTGRRPS